MKSLGWFHVLLVVCCLSLGYSAVMAQTSASGSSDSAATPAVRAQQNQLLTDAIKTLTSEAMELDELGTTKHPALFTRPHATVSKFTADMAPLVLRRMQQKFTDNPHRDTYIRWHLVWLLQKAAQEDKRRMGQELVKLVQIMPAELDLPERPWEKHEPIEIYRRWFQLYYSGRIVVGYPPFQRQVDPPESYQYMSADQAARVKANLEEAKKLREQFKTIIDQEAVAFNRKVRQINYMVRSYRGELIYLLLQTGDPQIAQLVVSEMDRLVRARSGIALDLMAYMYLAAFDGVLNLYDTNTLTSMGKKLEATARASESYMDYNREKRNFADYAFHMVLLLQQGGGLIQALEAPAAPQPPK